MLPVRHCFEQLQHCSNIATLCCAKNRRCESSRVTSTYWHKWQKFRPRSHEFGHFFFKPHILPPGFVWTGPKTTLANSSGFPLKVRKNGQQKTCNLFCNIAAKRVELRCCAFHDLRSNLLTN